MRRRVNIFDFLYYNKVMKKVPSGNEIGSVSSPHVGSPLGGDRNQAVNNTIVSMATMVLIYQF